MYRLAALGLLAAVLMVACKAHSYMQSTDGLNFAT
jgi:hypothetical protein